MSIVEANSAGELCEAKQKQQDTQRQNETKPNEIQIEY